MIGIAGFAFWYFGVFWDSPTTTLCTHTLLSPTNDASHEWSHGSYVPTIDGQHKTPRSQRGKVLGPLLVEEQWTKAAKIITQFGDYYGI